MKYYVLTLTATRVNEKEGINPSLSSYGSLDNLASKTIGLFDKKSNALDSFYKYYNDENEKYGENVILKTYQKGDKVEATIVTTEKDECGNLFTTMVNLTSIEVSDCLDIQTQIFGNYV